MKKIINFFICNLVALVACCQQDSLTLTNMSKVSQQIDRAANIYANRKYSFSISLSPYANIAHSQDVNVMGLFDITFSDRFRWLNRSNSAAGEATFGIGFLPYQGTQIHLGYDVELLPEKYRVMIYLGAQYSLGLPQATTLDNKSYINVYWHDYMMPFIGITYWPGKQDITSKTATKIRQYRHPGFRQLFYARLQIGYSFLLGPVTVDTTGAFDSHIYTVVRANTSNTLNVKLSVGINIPSPGYRQKYFESF